jgi:sugar lactone lactonase YvrE
VSSHSTDIHPAWAVPGGRVIVRGEGFPLDDHGPPGVRVGGERAHVAAASCRHLTIVVPPGAAAGTSLVQIDGFVGPPLSVEIARTLVTGIHQVDNPAFDRAGRLYVTHSGSRGNRAPVSLFRIGPDGVREPLPVDVGNPTSIARGPDGALFISSRFDGHVYRLTEDGQTELYVTDLGVPTGLAWGPDDALYVGDRSGSVFRVTPGRQVETFATLPASVAAFHLAFGPDGSLFVAAPTLASRDAVYRIGPDRLVEPIDGPFGRPQGLAFDAEGRLYVADALAGAAGLWRLDPASPGRAPELVLAAPALVGIAFDPGGGLVAASNDTVWRLDVPLAPLSRPTS